MRALVTAIAVWAAAHGGHVIPGLSRPWPLDPAQELVYVERRYRRSTLELCGTFLAWHVRDGRVDRKLVAGWFNCRQPIGLWPHAQADRR